MSEENPAVETVGASETQPINEDSPQEKARKILEARKAKNAEAKSTETGNAGSEEKPKKEPRAKKEPTPRGRGGIRFLRDIDPAVDKFNKQQQMLIDGMLKLRKPDGDDKDIVYRDELIKELGEVLPGSRQPTDRVLAFYMNGWKKSWTKGEGEKAVTIPPLFEVVSVKTVPNTPATPAETATA